jgi:glycosyltransferase involved in cell wall biosynthesis
MDPDNLWTGPHRVVFDISKHLAKKGHNVTVCTSDMVNIRTKITASAKNVFDDFEIVRVKNVSSHLWNATGLLITPALNKFLSEHIQDYDLIHIHEYTTYQNIVVHKYAKKYGVPYILQAHGSVPKIGKRFRKWLYYVTFGYNVLQDASKVIALSQTEAQQYRRIGVSEEKIAIIPNGIDLSEYADLPLKGSFRKKFNIPENNRIILYLGRIHKTKGIELLVKAYAYLLKSMKYDDALLVIAGPDDGYLAEIKSLSAHLNVSDSVLFTGFISTSDKLKALVDADVFVTPSFYGFPVTFLEACVVGVPIITTTQGDTLEWINDYVGYVTPPEYCDLAKAAHRILSDIELAERFSRNCRKIVKSAFSLDTVMDKMEQAYKEVAGVL